MHVIHVCAWKHGYVRPTLVNGGACNDVLHWSNIRPMSANNSWYRTDNNLETDVGSIFQKHKFVALYLFWIVFTPKIHVVGKYRFKNWTAITKRCFGVEVSTLNLQHFHKMETVLRMQRVNVRWKSKFECWNTVEDAIY